MPWKHRTDGEATPTRVTKQPSDTTGQHGLCADVLERVSDGLVALDSEWVYTYVNQNAARLLGREDPAELVGRHIWTEYPEGVGQPFYEAYYRAMETQQPVTLEEYYEPWDRYFENRIYPSSDGLTIYFHEVTEKRRALNALRENERYNRLLFNTSSVGLALCRMDGSMVDVNEAFACIIGRTVDETLLLSYWDFTPEVYAEQESARLESLELTGRYGPHEKEYIHREGHRVPVRLHGRLIEFGGERLIWSAAEDISEQVRAREALERSERTLRLLVEYAPAAIAMFDNEMRYIAASHRFLADYGLGDRQVVGLSHYDVFPEVPERWKEIHRRCLAGAIERCEEDAFPRDDGHVDWVRWEIHPWYEAENAIGGIILFSEVITERKETEFELRQHREHLEDLVRMRTTQLEAANSELEAFSYSVSHDLRAPLRHINGYVDLLTSRHRGEFSEKAGHYLDSIAQAAGQMTDLIDDLLEFARMNRTQLMMGEVDMEEAVRHAIASLADNLEDRDVEWTMSSLPSVHGDKAMLRQVWANLIDNAVKYTRDRWPAHIEVHAEEGPEEIVFSVIDDGVGFDMRYADKLFGVFQRLHTSTQFEGTGVGLASVRRIVERHGGRTWAEAEPDKGAAFFFALPIRRDS